MELLPEKCVWVNYCEWQHLVEAEKCWVAVCLALLSREKFELLTTNDALQTLTKQYQPEDKIFKRSSRANFKIPSVHENLSQVMMREHLCANGLSMLEVIAPDSWQGLGWFLKESCHLIEIAGEFVVNLPWEKVCFFENVQWLFCRLEREDVIIAQDYRFTATLNLVEQTGPLQNVLLVFVQSQVVLVLDHKPQNQYSVCSPSAVALLAEGSPQLAKDWCKLHIDRIENAHYFVLVKVAYHGICYVIVDKANLPLRLSKFHRFCIFSQLLHQ